MNFKCFSIAAYCLIILTSCSSYSKNKFKIERKFNFESREEYSHYIDKKGLFPKENILYIDSASLYRFFFDKMKGGKSVLYIGTYLNDSAYIKTGSFLEENTSCKGRLEDEILHNITFKEIHDSLIEKGRKMSAYKLYHLSNDTLFDMNKYSKKQKIFLLYAYAFGSYYDSMYKEIFRIQKENSGNADVFVVLADPIQRLK